MEDEINEDPASPVVRDMSQRLTLSCSKDENNP
jgi:hypothetical protein